MVVDASAIGPILIADEAEHLLAGLEEALTAGIVVPAHWLAEVANLLLVAQRRGRLDDRARLQARETVLSAVTTIDNKGSDEVFGGSWAIAQRHRLTIYDALYLEAAQRRGLPLATNDRALARAAAAEGVALFGR